MPSKMVIGVQKVSHPGYDDWDEEIYGMGYINSETYEIVIPAQYKIAYSFVGDFALVIKQNGKKCIINKQNEEILNNFNDVVLLKSEYGEEVFALTGNYSGLEFYNSGYGLGPNIRPRSTNYRLYNLTNGKLVIKKQSNVYDKIFDNVTKKIQFVGNYIFYRVLKEEIYEITNEGNLRKIKTEKDEILSKIIKEKDLHYKVNDFHYNDERTFNTHFWYIDTLNINLLLENIPENMQIVEADRGGWRFRDENPVYRIKPINYDTMYPLKKQYILYEVELEFIHGEKREKFVGLFDAFENKWVISPIEKQPGYSFFSTAYDDWITYRENYLYRVKSFYNTSSRKKFERMYQNEKYGTIIYVGSISEEYKEDGEDF